MTKLIDKIRYIPMERAVNIDIRSWVNQYMLAQEDARGFELGADEVFPCFDRRAWLQDALRDD